MKFFLSNNSTTKQGQIFTALVLTGILSVSGGFMLAKSVIAGPTNRLWETTSEITRGDRFTKPLPRTVANAVLRDISQKENISLKEVEIVNYQQQTWRNGCLGLPEAHELCTQALVPGWKVIASNGNNTWIYHTNSNGRSLRLANPSTPISSLPNNLPSSVKSAVVQAASQRLRLPSNQLMILQAEQRTWSDACLGLSAPTENCAQVITPGWRVVVGAPEQALVYHTNLRGSALRLNERESEIKETPRRNVNLPQNIARKILADTARRSGLPVSRLRITKVERRQWPDSCLGISDPEILCAAVIVPGWQVVVSDGEQRWVYRAGESGAIAFDEQASNVLNPKTLKPVFIPTRELPPPLDSNVIFRQLSSGGLVGRNYETTLLADGRLIRVRLGDANDSERSVRYISQDRVQRFQRLLSGKSDLFQDVRYPAPTGAADYITNIITSHDGTVQYSDISLSSLPEDLQKVILNWNQISKSY